MSTEYKVIAEHDYFFKALRSVQELVENHLNAGWKCVGGISVCYSGESGNTVMVSQALIREKT